MDLTDREREVAKLATSMTSREIAEVLQLSVKEVEECLLAIFKKLRGE